MSDGKRLPPLLSAVAGAPPWPLARRAALRRLAILGAASAGATTAGRGEAAPAPANGPPPSPVPGRPTRPPTDQDQQSPELWWEKVLTKDELRTLSVLCDLILPADERTPAASALGVPDFVDEWVSAPYPIQQADLQAIRGGLAWLDLEARRRFGKVFTGLSLAQRSAIADDLCDPAKAKPTHAPGALMFDRVRTISIIGAYTTQEGMKDIGYVGNVAAASWDGPPPELLRHLKLG